MVKLNNKSKEKVSIRRCPHCHQDMNVSIGFNKANFRGLFRKPTIEECIMLFIIFMAVGSFLIYRTNIEAYDKYIEENCTCSHHYYQIQTEYNLTDFELSQDYLDKFDKLKEKENANKENS